MKLAVAGGGTGGHLFPGLSVADYARDSGRVESIVFFGAERGIEFRLVPQNGYELISQPLEGLAGRGPKAAVTALRRLAGGISACRRELREREIDVVLGLGGYASSAAVVAARLSGVPVVLMEQNREPGLSNRTLGKFAAAICTSFADTAEFFPAGRCVLTGNPVRGVLENLERRTDADTLLVFGGSGGPRSLNRAVVAAFAELCKAGPLPPIVHQTGKHSFDEVRAAYAEAGVEADVREFIDDMAAAYTGAKLAICRSGATTIAELEATGTPSVLLPFPQAAGDHQTANARALVDAGAAVLVKDDETAPNALAETLSRLLGDTEALDSMARAARSLGRPGAAAQVFDVIERVAKGQTNFS